jgi:L,D-transpeptidase ErfK/SrfK
MALPILKKRFPVALALFLFALPSISAGDMIIGGETVVSAQKGDCLSSIGSRFGVDWQLVARENGFDPGKVCRTGQQFSLNNLRIVPKVVQDGIIVNVPDRMLYFFRHGELVMAFPVGLGLPQKEWQTPLGPFLIVRKTTNPTWIVPESIQREMERKGQPIKTVVPPGEDNPLGRYALHTSLQNVLIHETIWPTTVYQWRSHGCIRVSPESMEGFFGQVEKGTTGEIIYQPVSVAVQEGRIFLQVDKDIYRRVPSIDIEVQTKIKQRGLTESVDWAKVQEMIKQKTGIAEDVTR